MNNNFTETYDFLVSIIGSAPYGIIAVDLDGAVTMCNKLALNHLGIGVKTKAIIEQELLDFTKEVPRLDKKLKQCFDKGRQSFNLNNVGRDDSILNIKGRPILNGMIITTADITDAKATEHKLMKAILEGQENERSRLAKEIHDGIGPLMSTIKLNIESVKKDLDQASEKTLKKIDSMEDLVKAVATDIRGISHALMPSALNDFGLVSALENLCMKANAAEIVQVQFFQKGMEGRLDANLELGLYRITQELINNALKYAQAKNIIIQMVRHKQDVTLTVEDDGVGFESEKIPTLLNSGIGLKNIKTRSTVLKGTFSIEGSPGRGVIATVTIPV